VPIDGILFIFENLLEKIAASIVRFVPSKRDRLIQALDGVDLEGEIEFMLFDRILTDSNRIQLSTAKPPWPRVESTLTR